MSLLNASVAGALTWNLIGPVTGFQQATQGDSVNLILGALNYTTWNQAYYADLTIAASSTQVLDLLTLTDAFGTNYSATGLKVIVISNVSGNGVAITFGPNNALDPQQWFFSSTSGYITVLDGGGMLFFDPAASAGPTVDSTHNRFIFTNLSGSLPATVSVAIICSS